jgi:hypothetical protein
MEIRFGKQENYDNLSLRRYKKANFICFGFLRYSLFVVWFG